MKMLYVTLLLLPGCMSTVNPPFADQDAGYGDPPHTAYTCTPAPGVDAGACIADFRTGSGSDCVFTCELGVCDLIDVVDSGYRAVATCVAPGH